MAKEGRMRLTNVKFDETETPTEFSFTLSLDEVAMLYRLTGHLAPSKLTDISGDVRWGNALYDVADALGGALNRFFDAGADDVIPARTGGRTDAETADPPGR